MISLTDSQKIGIGLAGFGVFFLFFGMILFFDKALLAIGNEVSSLKNSILGMSMWMMIFSQSGIGEKAEDYDDVIDTSDFISDTGRVEAPEDYDDAVTAGPVPDNVDEDEAENYDDAITADQKSVLLTEDVSENYDDAVTAETKTNIITDTPEDDDDDDDDVISEEQDVGETEKCDEVEEKSQKDRDHVTETRHQRPFLRKLHFNFYKDKK